MRIGRRQFEWLALVIAIICAGGRLNELGGGETAFSRANQALVIALYVAAIPLIAVRYRMLLRLLSRDWLLLLLLAYTLLSSLWSTDPLLTVTHALVLIMATFFAIYIASRLTPDELLRAVLIALVIATALNALVIAVAPSYGIMQSVHVGAFRGIYSQKNSLARIVALAIPLLWISRSLKGGVQGAWRVFALGAAITLLIGSQSATGLVVCVILLAMVPAARILRVNKYLLPPVIILSVSAVGCIAIYLVTDSFADVAALLGRDVTLTGRTLIWNKLLDDILEKPLVGHGYRGYWMGWDGPSAEIWRTTPWSPNDSHNGYLDLLADLGLVGFSIMLAHIMLSLGNAIRYLRMRHEIHNAWGLIVCAHFTLYNITESSILRPTNFTWILYIMVATALIQSRQRDPQRAGDRNEKVELTCAESVVGHQEAAIG